MDKWLAIILPSVAAVLIGVVTYLIAPKVHWALDAKKMKFKNRLALIADVRGELDIGEFDALKFRESVAYSRIRPYLSKDLIDTIESVGENKLIVQYPSRGGGINNFKPHLLDSIAKLEKQWDLI
ncbi:MAG: hypothetical protein AB1531_05365 [Chloroflexota bacterium]